MRNALAGLHRGEAHYTRDMGHSVASLDVSVAGIAAKIAQGADEESGTD